MLYVSHQSIGQIGYSRILESRILRNIYSLFFNSSKPVLCLVHVIFDLLKLSSNLESLLSFKYSAEKILDQKEYKSLLLSFEALSFLS
jgi:hypothetical protein